MYILVLSFETQPSLTTYKERKNQGYPLHRYSVFKKKREIWHYVNANGGEGDVKRGQDIKKKKAKKLTGNLEII